MSRTKAIIAGLSIGMAMLAAAAASAQTIVVRSLGPSAKAYPAGRQLPVNRKVMLKAGDTLVLLDGRGTRTLRGPGSFDTGAAVATAASSSKIDALLRNGNSALVRTGSVRGVSNVGRTAATRSAQPRPARSPNIWFVDLGRSATVCVADPASVSVWRANRSSEQPMTISGGGKSATLEWAQGFSTQSWPKAELPIAEGAQYTVSGGGLAAPTSLRFTLLGPNPQGLEDTAAALIRKGCDTQLDLLIETVAVSDDAGGSAG